MDNNKAFLALAILFLPSVLGVDWTEQYTVDPRRSALVWTTGVNISLVVCPQEAASTTPVTDSDQRVARADYNIPVDLSPDVTLSVDQEREHRRREERIKTILEGVLGDIRIINQDRARLLGELVGEVISKCVRDTPNADTDAAAPLDPTFIDGLILPLGGAIGRLFLERPPPVEQMAERHTDIDLGANTFMKINSMQNSSKVRTLIAETHWEAFARYGVKLLGNTLTREEYLDAVGFAIGLTLSLTHQLNGTVLVHDVTTTARKYVGNFIRAYLLMSNQYYSFMEHSISWLAEDLATYTASDLLRIREPESAAAAQEEWPKFAGEANKGLKSLRLISVAMLLSYRNSAGDIRFQTSDVFQTVVPPSWMALKYMVPGM